MKRIITAGLLILCIGTIYGVDLESYQFINCLLGLGNPKAPFIFEDGVIFTSPSSYRRVGISFAHEGYSKVYWLRRLMVPKDSAELAAAGSGKVDPNKDSGILFHVQNIPRDMRNMDYRLVIDGLWTTDPLNSQTVVGRGEILQSRVSIPHSPLLATTFDSANLRINYIAPPGETITVAGSFNGWDPFMYEMKETNPGFYTFNLALPPGTYQYVFFHRGERFLDPNNPFMVYSKDGKTASEATIR